MATLEKENFLARFFLKKSQPFLKKRDANWKIIGWSAGSAITVMVLVLLFLPGKNGKMTNFHEKAPMSANAPPTISDGGGDALQKGQKSAAPFFGGSNSDTKQALARGSTSHGTSMIISRSGSDGTTSLPPGTRLQVRLIEKVTASSQAVPVIGVLEKDVTQEDRVAIPKGSKIFGEVTLNDNLERAQINWKSLRLPDGRERPLSAIGVSTDGQPGVEGIYHSDALKNSVGQTVSRFVGAYAAGTMQTGAFGTNPGGSDNGLNNAIAETAKDRADAWGRDLQKPKQWIELESGAACIAVLNQPFQFVDPGAMYGR